MVFENASMTIFLFLPLVAIGGFLIIALRMVLYYSTLRDEAFQSIQELGTALLEAEKLSDNYLSDSLKPSVVSKELQSAIQRMKAQKEQLERKALALTESLAKQTLYYRVNIGTGEWLQLGKDAKAATQAIELHIHAHKLEDALTQYDQPTNME